MRFSYNLGIAEGEEPELVCGDGVVSVHLEEECDDGNDIEDDYCNSLCETIGYCGDGEIQASAGEVCDGDTETTLCTNDCRVVVENDEVTNTTDAGVPEDTSVDAGN